MAKQNTKENNSIKNKQDDGNCGCSIAIVFAAFFSNVIVDGIILTVGLIEDELLVEFNEGVSFTSWVPSIMSGMELFVGPLASLLINKYNPSTVAIFGSILGAGSFFISAYARNVSELIITIGFGVGTSLGLIYLAVIVSLLTHFEKYRSVATGIAFAGTGVGATTFSPLVAFLIDQFGWRQCLMVLAIILLNCSLLGACFRPKKIKKLNDILEVENQCGLYEHTNRHSIAEKKYEIQKCKNYYGIVSSALENVKKFMHLHLLKNPIFILFIVSDFVTSMCLYVPYFSLPSYSNALGMKEDGPKLLMVTGTVNILGPFIMGYICNKISNRIWVYSSCLIICSIAIALFVMCSSFLSLAICSAVFAFNMGACVSLRSVILTDLLRVDNIENAFGLLLLFEGIGTFIGPPIDGFLHDLSDSYTPGFLFTSFMVAFSGFVLIPMPALQNYIKKKHPPYRNRETVHF